jgi:hypothetical protein
MPIHLRWSAALTYGQILGVNWAKELASQFSKKPGVYIHVDHRTSRVAYVGKSNASTGLLERQREHYSMLVGGRYLIPDSPVDPGSFHWTPDRRKEEYLRTILDRNEFKRIVDHAFDYAEKVRIYLSPLHSSDDAKIVERELLFACKPLDTTWGTKSPPHQRIDLKHDFTLCPELEPMLLRE